MDAAHLPAQIATCPHCQTPLYEDAPMTKGLHVACAVDARRDRAPYVAGLQ